MARRLLLEILGVVCHLESTRPCLLGEESCHAHIAESRVMTKGLPVDRHGQKLRIASSRVHRQRQTLGEVISAP